jgi:LPS-assembly lipoprotein
MKADQLGPTMLTKRIASLMLSLFCLAMLAACGFQLRGTGSNYGTMPFKSVYVAGSENSNFVNTLKRYITASGTDVTPEPTAAEAIIEVLREAQDKSILSRNSQGRVREYTLQYTLQFRVKNKQNAILLPADEISLRRTISFNESAVLAKESEEAMLYRDMQNDMVQQVVRRIAAIRPQNPAADTANVAK